MTVCQFLAPSSQTENLHKLRSDKHEEASAQLCEEKSYFIMESRDFFVSIRLLRQVLDFRGYFDKGESSGRFKTAKFIP